MDTKLKEGKLMHLLIHGPTQSQGDYAPLRVEIPLHQRSLIPRGLGV